MEPTHVVNESENHPLSPPSPMSIHENRLSIPFAIRMPVVTVGAFVTGLALGLSHGGKTAGLRFRAENSHRFPTSTMGWYFYHKSKNYHMMLGGVKEGLKMGPKIAFWGGSFFLIEEAIDEALGAKEFWSTAIAGLTISGAFSLWNRFPLLTAARTIRVGGYSGLAFGLAQDTLGLARGRRPGWLDLFSGRNHHTMDPESRAIDSTQSPSSHVR